MKKGTTIVQEAGKSFYEIKDSIHEVVSDVQHMNGNIKQISTDIESIVHLMKDIENISTKNVDEAIHVIALSEEQSAGMQEMSSSMALLSKMAEELNERSKQFTV